MQTQVHTPAEDAFRQACANILRITSRQLSAWVIESRLGVVDPDAEEVPWEGTEIDVRRTVL